MAGEQEPLENLVARRIGEQLGEGGLDRLIQAQQAVAQRIHPAGIESREAFGTPTAAGGMAAQLQPLQATFTTKVTLSVAEIEMIPAAVDDIRAASPELADDIQNRPPHDIMLALNAFMALMQIVQVILAAIPLIHPEPATQTQIIDLCKQAITCVIQVPPAHGQ